jgi:branched-chain amino acid transport system permease protein
VPYLRILVPGLVMLLGFVGIVELLSFLTIGMAEGKQLILLGHPIDVVSPVPWLVSAACLLGGCVWLTIEARLFKPVWDGLMEAARSR